MATVIGTGSESQPGYTPRKRRTATSAAERGSDNALQSLVQGEIIPRLLVAHSLPSDRRPASGTRLIDPKEAERFAPLALRLEAEELFAEVEQHLDRGCSVESVFVDLLAPSARKLGEYWEADHCDFVDVTMGLWRLQEVMRALTLRFPSMAGLPGAPRASLFSPMPGEQHSFGSLMLEEVFSRGGWQSEALIEPTRKDLLRQVAERSFDLVGLTVSCDCPSATIADLITALRSVSRNPAVNIMIGGRLVNDQPELVELVGADGTAADAASALELAERLVVANAAYTPAFS